MDCIHKYFFSKLLFEHNMLFMGVVDLMLISQKCAPCMSITASFGVYAWSIFPLTLY